MNVDFLIDPNILYYIILLYIMAYRFISPHAQYQSHVYQIDTAAKTWIAWDMVIRPTGIPNSWDIMGILNPMD
jgi:hypothetical protein